MLLGLIIRSDLIWSSQIKSVWLLWCQFVSNIMNQHSRQNECHWSCVVCMRLLTWCQGDSGSTNSMQRCTMINSDQKAINGVQFDQTQPITRSPNGSVNGTFQFIRKLLRVCFGLCRVHNGVCYDFGRQSLGMVVRQVAIGSNDLDGAGSGHHVVKFVPQRCWCVSCYASYSCQSVFAHWEPNQ